MIQALSGVMSIVGEPGRPPVHAGLAIGDLCGGMGAVISIVTALYAREKTGKGQCIDLSMLDMIISMWTFIGQYYLLARDIPKPLGSGHVSNVPVGAFKAADGYIMIQCSSQKFYENLATVISKEEEGFRDLPKDERFNTPAKRLERRKELEKIIGDALSRKPKEVWLKALEAGDVPFAPVNDLAQALSDPQVLSRNMLVEFEYPSGKKVRTIGNPIKMSQASKEVFTPPPHMGEHNEDIICGLLGYTKEDLDQLRRDKVI
jgi:CoA:oxalate CoA-transferase